MRAAIGTLLVCATLIVQSCASPTTSATPTPPTVSPGRGSNVDAQTSADAALQDAATHLGVKPSDLRVDQVEAREWPDSSLGCPRPGLMYSQVVTPGYLIVISGAGKRLEYHSDARGHVVLCSEQ